MFHLTREVRFALNAASDEQLEQRPTNPFGGYPSLTGLGLFCTVRVTLAGQLQPRSQYLLNIKEVDDAVRGHIETLRRVAHTSAARPQQVLQNLFDHLAAVWPDRLESVALLLTPTFSLSIYHRESPMLQLSQKFEFSASHRLHNPALSDEQNRRTFGKCNNPLGHGHNYEVQVTVRGQPSAAGTLLPLPKFEHIVDQTVIQRFDHKHLNAEVPEFSEIIPSVENIARVIYQLLKPRFATENAALASVTVWETAKTWCEYSE